MVWIRVALALLLLAFTATAEVVPLTDDTFAEKVNSDDSFWFIDFYANWCTWSQRLAPAWEQLGADDKVRQAGVKIGAVDCDANKATCQKARVKGYPTMKIFLNGEEWKGHAYLGDRDVESMKAFALEMQKQLAPLQLDAAPAEVNSWRKEAPRFSVGMVLELFGF